MTEENNDILLSERAGRARRLRDTLRLSRGYFERTYDIPQQTLQGWEDARWGSLTDKGAKKLVKAYQGEGLHVTVEWLMYGVGPDPFATYKVAEPGNPAYQVVLTEQAIISQELQAFHQNNPNAIDTIIQDDAMLPCLAPGDHVAGQRFFEQDIEQALGLSCMIQTKTGLMLVRQLEQGSESGLYTLSSLNPNTTVAEPRLQDVSLFSASPIIWIRKPGIMRKVR
jgi:DNA-binding transcriptional regulator YiaG